jgi:hypothetical protein
VGDVSPFQNPSFGCAGRDLISNCMIISLLRTLMDDSLEEMDQPNAIRNAKKLSPPPRMM